MTTEALTAATTEVPPLDAGATESLELSVVIPCLNEADTIAHCVARAWEGIEAAGVDSEVVVADNGSTDGSQEIAARAGARVVHVAARGYGSALMGGIEAARGRYVVMGDADGSYDFRDIPKFLAKLREGHELVQGCRLPSGGGRVLPGAMPFLHRWWGNPMFSAMARRMFRAPVHDVYCGLRAFSRSLYLRLDQRCTGMEFATEMIVKASLGRERIAEVPVTLHPDGRRSHPPHLKTFRDGWRTLRFLLLYSPRWLFLYPGVFLVLAGLAGYALAMPGARVLGAVLDAHTLLFASLAILCGYQALLFAVFAKTFAVAEGLMPRDRRVERFFAVVTLERGLACGAAAAAAGLVLLGATVEKWRAAGFGDLDYPSTMRWVIPGVTLTALGFQTVLSSFFASILGMKRR
jgi:glycosyltransferase involved in cell wall biosynthesis